MNLKYFNFEIKLLFIPYMILLIILNYESYLPYYNDDISLISSIKDYGLSASFSHWISEYGYMYRPIGIFLTYVFYNFFSDYLEVFYSINILFYFICALQLYALIKKIDKNMAVFVSLFFVIFPLNITAYLQIPSLMMIISINGFLCFLRLWVYYIQKNNYLGLLICTIFWLLLLLVYEQIVALTLIPLIIIYYFYKQRKISFYKYFKTTLLFVVTTMIFLAGYFFSSQNPKIISLRKINIVDISTEKISTAKTDLKKQINHQNRKNYEEDISIDIKNKFLEGNAKVKKFFIYFVDGISYASEKIFKSKLIVTIVFIFSLVCFSFFLSKNECRFVFKELVYVSGFGLFWFVSSLLPFMLYGGIKIPPYVFVLPSIGLAFFCFGVYYLILNFFNLILFKQVLNATISFLFLACFFNQIGYYYGLKEEFNFWDRVTYLNSFNVSKLFKDGSIEITDHVKKKNNHIFWIEKFVGARYLQSKIGNDITTPIVVTSKKSIKIGLQK